MEKPEHKIEEVISTSDLTEMGKELSEVAIDSILKDGVLKEIPIVNIIVGTYNFGNTLNKYFFTKKIYTFLFQLKDIPEEKRKMKIDELNQSGKYRKKVGESILELIDKIESDLKPEIIGRLFKAVLSEIIDYESYLKLTHIVKTIYIEELLWLNEQYPKREFDEQIKIDTSSPLITSGLLKDDIRNANAVAPDDDGEGTITTRKLSNLGIILLDIGLN